MLSNDFNSEWQYQLYYLKQLLSKPKHFINHIDEYSKRSILIFFFNFQLIFLVINYFSQNIFVSNLIEFIQSTENLATYFPSLELYFNNKLFYLSFLISVHYALPIMLFSILAYLVSKFENVGFNTLLKQHLTVFAIIPFTLLGMNSIIIGLSLTLVMSIYITIWAHWKTSSRVIEYIVWTILLVLSIILTQMNLL